MEVVNKLSDEEKRQVVWDMMIGAMWGMVVPDILEMPSWLKVSMAMIFFLIVVVVYKNSDGYEARVMATVYPKSGGMTDLQRPNKLTFDMPKKSVKPSAPELVPTRNTRWAIPIRITAGQATSAHELDLEEGVLLTFGAPREKNA